jgi:hypothetical protein
MNERATIRDFAGETDMCWKRSEEFSVLRRRAEQRHGGVFLNAEFASEGSAGVTSHAVSLCETASQCET